MKKPLQTPTVCHCKTTFPQPIGHIPRQERNCTVATGTKGHGSESLFFWSSSWPSKPLRTQSLLSTFKTQVPYPGSPTYFNSLGTGYPLVYVLYLDMLLLASISKTFSWSSTGVKHLLGGAGACSLAFLSAPGLLKWRLLSKWADIRFSTNLFLLRVSSIIVNNIIINISTLCSCLPLY